MTEKVNKLVDSLREEINLQYKGRDKASESGKLVTEAVHREIARSLERIIKRMEN